MWSTNSSWTFSVHPIHSVYGMKYSQSPEQFCLLYLCPFCCTFFQLSFLSIFPISLHCIASVGVWKFCWSGYDNHSGERTLLQPTPKAFQLFQISPPWNSNRVRVVQVQWAVALELHSTFSSRQPNQATNPIQPLHFLSLTFSFLPKTWILKLRFKVS